MDIIDKEIKHAQAGHRKEVAYEIYKHPAKPKTNLPPMKARGVENSNSNYKSSSNSSDGGVAALLVFGFLFVFFIFIVGMMMGFW